MLKLMKRNSFNKIESSEDRGHPCQSYAFSIEERDLLSLEILIVHRKAYNSSLL
jgi:hypothetical protein